MLNTIIASIYECDFEVNLCSYQLWKGFQESAIAYSSIKFVDKECKIFFNLSFIYYIKTFILLLNTDGNYLNLTSVYGNDPFFIVLPFKENYTNVCLEFDLSINRNSTAFLAVRY